MIAHRRQRAQRLLVVLENLLGSGLLSSSFELQGLLAMLSVFRDEATTDKHEHLTLEDEEWVDEWVRKLRQYLDELMQHPSMEPSTTGSSIIDVDMPVNVTEPDHAANTLVPALQEAASALQREEDAILWEAMHNNTNKLKRRLELEVSVQSGASCSSARLHVPPPVNGFRFGFRFQFVMQFGAFQNDLQ